MQFILNSSRNKLVAFSTKQKNQILQVIWMQLSSVHTKQLVGANFVAATNLPVCIGLQLVSCNFQKLLATVFWFRALLYFLQLVAADLSSSSNQIA